MSRSLHPVAAVLATVLMGTSLPTMADELNEVTRLHRAGQTAAALHRAERIVASRPDDASMRFLLGVLLAESQRKVEAVAVFQKLTLDHPQLAEPHNNLAALHAAAGDYDKARFSLEQALRARPDYATAHENLGDVLAVLASQAYARAARLDPSNASLPPKMALVRELFTPRAGLAATAKAIDSTIKE